MKKNVLAITGLLVAVLAAGAIFRGLFVRFSTSPMEQEASSVKITKELSQPPFEARPTPSSSERDHKMETLIQQVSIMSQNMKTLQDQINVLSARIQTEGTGKKEEPETIDSVIARRDENPAEQPSMRYTIETRDDQWASPTEEAITTEFTTNPRIAGVTIDSIECRSSLCRLVWQYKPDMTNEEAFATENEMLVAMNKAGFNASSQNELGGGLTEGYFWYNPPPEVTPGSNPSSPLGIGK